MTWSYEVRSHGQVIEILPDPVAAKKRAARQRGLNAALTGEEGDVRVVSVRSYRGNTPSLEAYE